MYNLTRIADKSQPKTIQLRKYTNTHASPAHARTPPPLRGGRTCRSGPCGGVFGTRALIAACACHAWPEGPIARRLSFRLGDKQMIQIGTGKLPASLAASRGN